MVRLTIIAIFVCTALFSAIAPSHAREPLGIALVATGVDGKIRSISMRKSTGNKKADARVMLFARTTFYKRVPKPRPNHRYVYPVMGITKDVTGSIRIVPF